MTYTVSLTLSIEAETEAEAINEFDERVKSGHWAFDSVDIETEKEQK